jgi:intracellular septation protein
MIRARFQRRRRSVDMQTLMEFAPWILFGLVYKFGGGLYPATVALMVGMVLLLAYDWLTTRKVPQMHLILAIMCWVFGAATLILRDVRFLQWKASVFYWIAGLLFAGSVWIGRQTLLERLLGKGLPDGVTIPTSEWRVASLIMGGFYVLLGVVNIWVAQQRSEADWVTFKVWIAGPLAIVVTLGMLLWLFRKVLFTREDAS